MGASTGDMLVDDPQVLESIFADCPILIATHCEDTPTIKVNEAKAREQFGEDVEDDEVVTVAPTTHHAAGTRETVLQTDCATRTVFLLTGQVPARIGVDTQSASVKNNQDQHHRISAQTEQLFDSQLQYIA